MHCFFGSTRLKGLLCLVLALTFVRPAGTVYWLLIQYSVCFMFRAGGSSRLTITVPVMQARISIIESETRVHVRVSPLQNLFIVKYSSKMDFKDVTMVST